MNFIASTLIAVLDNEELAFWVFMWLIMQKEMKALFLPVNKLVIKLNIGSSWASFEEFPNGTTNKISYAKIVCSLKTNINDNRLLHF